MFRVIFALVLIAIVTACAPQPAFSPPQKLYVFNVQNLHLDHFEWCGGPCSPETVPPKSYPDLLSDYDTLIFLSSLQGIVNKEAPQLYLIHNPTDQFWLDTYRTPKKDYGWLGDTEIVELPTLTAVLDTFAADIDGLVAWDDAIPATLNVATTLAGVENLAIVRDGSELQNQLILLWPVKTSLVDKFIDDRAAYHWAMDEYLATGRADATLLAYFEDGTPAQKYQQNEMTRGGVYALERDYVIQQGGFAFDLSPWADESPEDAALFEAILKAARTKSGLKLIKVWGFSPWYEKYSTVSGGIHLPVDGEWESTWLFSRYGAYLQGGGGDAWGAAMANVSVHRFAPKPKSVVPSAVPSVETLRDKGYLLADGRINPDMTFVLLYVGDYDLVHPTEIAWANGAQSTWQDETRGQLPLAWGINPAMEEEIPGIMAYFLATRTDNDFLVGANSGAGYVNPQGISRRFQWQWMKRTGDYYRKYGIDVQGFLLNGRGYSLPPEWVSRYAKVAPHGIISPDFEIEGAAPRLVDDTPYIGIEKETLGDFVPDSASILIRADQNLRDAGKPPFVVLRSAFQKPAFLKAVIENAQSREENKYVVLDPETFFALLKIEMENQ